MNTLDQQIEGFSAERLTEEVRWCRWAMRYLEDRRDKARYRRRMDRCNHLLMLMRRRT